MDRTEQFEGVLRQLHCLNANDAGKSGIRPTLSALFETALGDSNETGALSQVIVEGDRVAIAVIHAIAGVEAIVGELAARIAAITKSALDNDESLSIGFVFAPGTMDPRTCERLNEKAKGFRCLVHDPENEQQQALLAIGCEANPLAINRQLFDADVVLVLASPTGKELSSERPALFPVFGSADGRSHYESQKPKKRVADRQSVERNLGADFQIAVTTGPGGMPDSVFAGISAGIGERVAKRVRESWALIPLRDFDLVVSTIQSPSGLEPWDELRAALKIASQHATDNAPLVVISPIERAPATHVAHEIELAMDDDDHAGGTAPRDLQASIGHRPVYLASGLDRQTVEELGFGYLESAEELGRLVKRFPNSGLIRDAHKCISIENANVAAEEI